MISLELSIGDHLVVKKNWHKKLDEQEGMDLLQTIVYYKKIRKFVSKSIKNYGETLSVCHEKCCFKVNFSLHQLNSLKLL